MGLRYERAAVDFWTDVVAKAGAAAEAKPQPQPTCGWPPAFTGLRPEQKSKDLIPHSMGRGEVPG